VARRLTHWPSSVAVPSQNTSPKLSLGCARKVERLPRSPGRIAPSGRNGLTMQTLAESLLENRIRTRHYPLPRRRPETPKLLCPRCSRDRKKPNDPCLSLTIEGARGCAITAAGAAPCVSARIDGTTSRAAGANKANDSALRSLARGAALAGGPWHR
jgi:hypothetical protein